MRERAAGPRMVDPTIDAGIGIDLLFTHLPELDDMKPGPGSMNRGAKILGKAAR